MKKIIVADDEELIRRLVSDFLTAEGYEPRSAAELLPRYLRLSQAERERLERLKKETK